MVIKREHLLQRPVEAKHNDFIKIVTGIRRCGRSYLLVAVAACIVAFEANAAFRAISIRSVDDNLYRRMKELEEQRSRPSKFDGWSSDELLLYKEKMIREHNSQLFGPCMLKLTEEGKERFEKGLKSACHLHGVGI